MSRRVEDMTDDDLRRMLVWHVRRSDSIGDLERAQEAQDEIWRRYQALGESFTISPTESCLSEE